MSLTKLVESQFNESQAMRAANTKRFEPYMKEIRPIIKESRGYEMSSFEEANLCQVMANAVGQAKGAGKRVFENATTNDAVQFLGVN